MFDKDTIKAKTNRRSAQILSTETIMQPKFIANLHVIPACLLTFADCSIFLINALIAIQYDHRIRSNV